MDPGYKACYEAVMAGRTVTLAVAYYAAADFRCNPAAGLSPGLYRCWLENPATAYPTAMIQLVEPTGPQYMNPPENLTHFESQQ